MASVAQSLQQPTLASVTRALESSPHNIVHSLLGGAMGNVFVSPADPVFFSHHATIDLLYMIYHTCNNPEGDPSDDVSDPRVFASCMAGRQRVTPTSIVTMRAVPAGATWFDAVPRRYGQLTNVRALGYGYNVTGVLGDHMRQCTTTNSTDTRRLQTQTNDNALVVGPVGSNSRNFLDWRSNVEMETARSAFESSDISLDANVEMNKMMVMLYANCLPGGPTQDYTPAFKAMWRIKGQAPSKALYDRIQNGSDPIQIPNWAGINTKYFGCGGDKKYVRITTNLKP
jgi:tyrosinase